MQCPTAIAARVYQQGDDGEGRVHGVCCRLQHGPLNAPNKEIGNGLHSTELGAARGPKQAVAAGHGDGAPKYSRGDWLAS